MKFDDLPVSGFLESALEKKLSEITSCRRMDVAGFDDGSDGIEIRRNADHGGEFIEAGVVGCIDDEIVRAFEDGGLAPDALAAMKVHHMVAEACAIMEVAEENDLDIPDLGWIDMKSALEEPEKAESAISEIYGMLGADESHGGEGWFQDEFRDAMDSAQSVLKLSIEARHEDGKPFSLRLAINFDWFEHQYFFPKDEFTLAKIEGPVPETAAQLDKMLDSLVAKGLPLLNLKEKWGERKPVSGMGPK